MSPRAFSRVVLLLLAMLATCASVSEAIHVRPRSRHSGRALGASPGRRRQFKPPHGAFGAKKGRARDHAPVKRTKTAPKRNSEMKLSAAELDEASRQRLRERMERARDEKGALNDFRRRRLRELDAEYEDVGDVGDHARWDALDDVPDALVCDACKLTVRGVHADAVDASRTMPQSSWKALDEEMRGEVVRLVWTEFTCARFKNVTALRRDREGRLVDLRADTRESEITNPTEARIAGDDVVDAKSAEMLANVCELLRNDTQVSNWLSASLAAFNDVRPMSDLSARRTCDKIAADGACTPGKDEL